MNETRIRKTRAPALCLCAALLAAITLPAAPGARAAELPQAGLSYEQYPSLAETYKDYFMVGTIDRFSTELRKNFIAYNFNAVTHENNMKPSSTQNVKGAFTFGDAWGTINTARSLNPAVNMIGHTLTWHSQSPTWLWDAPALDRDTALANLNAHIEGVLGEFGGELYSVDVVNEAIGSVNLEMPSDWKFALIKGEGWYPALGWEWVELAFLKAAEVVDKNGWDCKLYYNDFGLDGSNKARAVYEMVRSINNRHAAARANGKPLIEGIGMQGHYNSGTRMSGVEESVALFSRLEGVSVSFTEVDIEFPNTGELTDAQTLKQAQKYAQLFELLKKYAAGPGNTTDNPKIIERVTFWGTDDGASWKSGGLPLLFNAPADGVITAKEALLGALWPEEYLQAHPYSEADDPMLNYKVPGVYVYSLDRGDTWAGANIILGNDANAWPWAVADEVDNEVAFVPEKDETYRLSFSWTALGTLGVRVRWITDNTNGSYTAADSRVVTSTPPHNIGRTADFVATYIPAHYNAGMVNAGTYTIVTEIKLDGSLPAGDLIGNIAIRGTLGGNSYEINWLKMERVSDGALMFMWDPENPAEPPEPPEPPEPSDDPPGDSPSPSSSDTPPASPGAPSDSGAPGAWLYIIIGSITVIAAGAVTGLVIRSKRK